MGKGSLIAIGLALTLSSLIPVDSIDQVVVTARFLNKIDINSNCYRCNPITLKSDDSYLKSKHFGSLVNLVVSLLVFIYCCLAIGSLCDRHFVPNLTSLGDKFLLPPDITRAILIPFGTSGPEIFSSAVGIFFTNNDIGTGAIIGSAVFNLLAIPAASGLAIAFFIGRPLKMEPIPILRDSLFYILSVIVLILVIKDNRVDLLDSSLLTLLFGIYVAITIYNAKKSTQSGDVFVSNECSDNCLSETTDVSDEKTSSLVFNNNKSEEMLEQIEDNEIDFINNRFLSLILLPVYILFDITLSKESPVITFIVSSVWLSGLSYGTVWAIDGLSEVLSIPQTISGMTILAAGSAVPDLVTSIVVIRKNGSASDGLCAAITSNIFAIVLGLGLPWFLKCLINSVKNGNTQTFIPIESDALPYTSAALLIIIFVFLLTLKLCSWKLSTIFCISCAFIHLLFLFVSISLEFSFKR